MKQVSLYIISLLVVYNCLGQQPEWKPVLPGVWKAIIGSPEQFDLLKAASSSPNVSAIEQISGAGFPLDQTKIYGATSDHKTNLRFPLSHDEQLYGFGLNFQTVQQRGRIMQLHVDHYAGRDNGRTHAPTPFYLSSRGYGVFINSARYIQVYAGTTERKDATDKDEEQDRNTSKKWKAQPYSDAVDIQVPAPGVEVYVFSGPTMLDVMRRFNLFNGGGCLPPRWGLGFTQRVKSLFNSEEVKEEAAEFERRGYPLDFIGLEPGWQSRSYPGTFTWDSSRYPKPAAFVAEMLQKHIHLNLWINPYVSGYAGFAKEIFPFTASHKVWNGLVPDFTVPEARNIFFGQLKKDQLSIGVSGYKIDETDGYDSWLWPDVASFPGGLAAEQMRQTYGILMQRYSTQMFHDLNKRTYGLTRASNAGGSSYPYVIYNDYYKHEDFITALINSGFASVLWTPEVRASNSAEEWLRRMQTVIFSPMAMINAWASGTKPWSYEEVAPQVKALTLLRMQMMPYWYTAFARYHYQGVPPFRAINFEEGMTQIITDSNQVTGNLQENPYLTAVKTEIKDEYMAGDYLLVAPMFAGKKTRKVLLPKGNWYDFHTGKLAGNGEEITVTPGLDKIPVYVKDGGIIPYQPPRLHAPKAGEKVDIEFRHYGEKETSYNFYDDDGETFDYEHGAYSWREVTMKKNKQGRWTGTISAAVKDKPNTIGKVSWKQMGE